MHSWYTQYKTAQAFQQGDLDAAHSIYSDLVKESPQDPLVNFNEGFLLYKKGDYGQAAASFERAAQSSTLTDEQQQEAYFNVGNAQAYQKEWQQAINAYDKVLNQNPDHTRARHNKEIVRKLLEQEKQKQKQDQQKQDQKQQQDKQDQQEKDNSEQQQEQHDQQGSPKEKDETGNTPEHKRDKEQGQEQQRNNAGNDSQKTADEHKKERSDAMNKDKETEQKKAQEQKHTTPSSSKNNTDYKTSSATEQEEEKNQEQNEIAQLLEHVDQKDTQQAKRLMQVLLAQPKGGQYENKPSW